MLQAAILGAIILVAAVLALVGPWFLEHLF